MTIKVCGMTLSEIAAKFDEFDNQRAEAKKKYEAGKKRYASEPTFTPYAEYDFVDKIHKSIDKADEELKAKFAAAKTDEERKELKKAHDEIVEIKGKCWDIEWERMHPII